MASKQPEPGPVPAKPARKPRASKAEAAPKADGLKNPNAISHAGEPLDLSALRKTHVLRVGLKGRKGAWVGHLVSAEPADQKLTMKVKWMAAPRKVSFADIAVAEARTADKASKYTPVRLDA